LGVRLSRNAHVDRDTFPSSTLSTHYFRGGRAVSVLNRLGVLDDALGLGCPRLECEYRFRNGATEPIVSPAQQPGDVTFCLSVRRAQLDHLLIRHAASRRSVDVLEASVLNELVWEDGRVAGARFRTPEGETTVRARCVVGADGRHSRVAKLAGARVQQAEEGHRGIYYCYVRGFEGPAGSAPDGAEFHQDADELAYVFPSDAGVTCIALSVNLAIFAWLREQPAERFRARIASYAGLAERFAAATQVGQLLGCGPTRNYVRVPAGPGWTLVGDAGMHQDPWSGTGIDKAMVHATFLADALKEWWTGAASEAEALGTYHRLRDVDGLESYQRTVSISRDLRQLLAA
jgi:menaquinone-9 beta-reductase